MANNAKPGEKHFGQVAKRLGEKENGYGRHFLWDEQIAPTIVSGDSYIRGMSKQYASDCDIINAQSFPKDYDFTPESAKYICGMSVPPVMMAQVASEVYRQWLR